MQQKPFLSICIATYNRATTLIDLIVKILESKRTDIEIVVTDNASTDDTINRLRTINDSRLRICNNEKNIGGANNTLKSVYNAHGKYALYCNDRDLIGVQNINNIISFLESKELSFVYLYAVKEQYENKAVIFSNPVESFIGQDYTHHPTGMIFNRELISSSKIKIEDLYNCNVLYALDFLARELFLCGPTAILYDVVSYEREKEFKVQNTSKFQSGNHKMFFMPDVRLELMKQTVEHVDKLLDKNVSIEQREKVFVSCCKYFYKDIIVYKTCMNDKYEASHYGFNRKYVSNGEIRKFEREYNICIKAILVEKLRDLPYSLWNKIYKTEKLKLLLRCIKYDILHFYKRENNDRII